MLVALSNEYLLRYNAACLDPNVGTKELDDVIGKHDEVRQERARTLSL
jgi:hypothetical protein